MRVEQVEVVGVRHRERVVGRDRAAVVVERLEQREVDDPERAASPPSFTGGRPRSSRSVPSTWFVIRRVAGDDEHEVAGRARRARRRCRAARPRSGTSTTGDSSAPPSRTRIHTSPAAPSCLGPVDEPVDASSGDTSPSPGHADALHRVGLERLELGRREHRRRGRRAPCRSGCRACRSRSAPSPRATSCAGPSPGGAPVTASTAAPTASVDDRHARPPGPAKLISMSYCMNSNCRSARRSSSRRQRAIWK